MKQNATKDIRWHKAVFAPDWIVNMQCIEVFLGKIISLSSRGRNRLSSRGLTKFGCSSGRGISLSPLWKTSLSSWQTIITVIIITIYDESASDILLLLLIIIIIIIITALKIILQSNQVYKCCLYEGCCGRNATDWIYLIVYPLFTGQSLIMVDGSIQTIPQRIYFYTSKLKSWLNFSDNARAWFLSPCL